MSYRWVDAEAEEVDYPEEDDRYGYDDSEASDEGDWYEDDEEFEAAEDEWGWANEREAFEPAYYDDGRDSWQEYEASSYEDSAEMAEALREVLHEDYQDLSTEEMEQVLFDMLDHMSPAAEWSFTSALKKIGGAGMSALKNPTVSRVAGKALPIVGGAVGTYFGGPVGTTIGAKLGGQLAGALPKGHASHATSGKQQAARGSAKSGSVAAAQLLPLLQNEKLIKSLLGLAMGENGRQSVKLGPGKPSVDAGPLMSLAKSLFEQAAADADELARESEPRYRYLLDSEGEYAVDPADPGERDRALYEALLDAEAGAYAPWADEMSPEAWPPRWMRRRRWRRQQQRKPRARYRGRGRGRYDA